MGHKKYKDFLFNPIILIIVVCIVFGLYYYVTYQYNLVLKLCSFYNTELLILNGFTLFAINKHLSMTNDSILLLNLFYSFE